MIWPWVSRLAYTEVRERAAEWQRMANAWVAAFEAERKHSADLTRELLELKRQNFVRVEPLSDTVPQVESLPSEIERAIDARVPEDGPLRGTLNNYAARRLREVEDPDVVAAEIMDGANLDDWR